MERESRLLEFKRQATDYKKLARTVVAFANGDGGRIIIGIDEKTGKAIGLADEDIDVLLERLPVSMADCIQPSFSPRIFEQTVHDKEVLVVEVFPGHQKPYFIESEGIEKGVYVRVGAHTRRAGGEMLEELRLLRSRCGYDEQPVPACTFKELDVSPLPLPLRSEKSLLSLDVIRYDPFSGALHPTRAGILMFHPDPERYVPEATIIASRMRGDTGRDTIETHEINGPLPDQLKNAVAFIEEWLGRNPGLKKERYKHTATIIPMDVVREVLRNALFNLQYRIAGAIKVAMYADRLEVFSPGHFAGPFIKESLGDGTSYIRNRVVALLARRLGLIEKRGTGIRLILDMMKAQGSLPEFIEGPNWFKVVLPFGRVEKPASFDPRGAIMDLFEKDVEITSAKVCKLMGVSKATAVGMLEKLIASGRIKRIGKGPRTRYVVTGY